MAATDKQLHIKGLGEEISALYNLPWHTPLEQWPEDETLAAQRGISRHIVRLVRSTPDPASEIYAVKETVEEFAVREYEALRELSLRGAPAVAQVAIVTNRYSQNGEELPCAIVTRFLPYSLPYRVILSGQITQHEITNMANALAYLLVRLHLLGFWWGDCSLSNTLFRRDAEGFAAYLVDAETGEFQKKLSDGQREHDLELARFNVAAELEDLKIEVRYFYELSNHDVTNIIDNDGKKISNIIHMKNISYAFKNYLVQIRRLRMVIEPEFNITRVVQPSNQICYLAARGYWLDDSGKKKRVFTRNFGKEIDYPKGKDDPNAYEDARREIQILAINEYESLYP